MRFSITFELRYNLSAREQERERDRSNSSKVDDRLASPFPFLVKFRGNFHEGLTQEPPRSVFFLNKILLKFHMTKGGLGEGGLDD